MTDLRERLLEAHVQHELARWREPLPARVDAWVAELFRWMQTVTLREVSSSEQITGIIERYAIELRVSGGIMELAGEMTQLVIDSPASEDTRLDELLGDATYEQFADKVMRLSGVWRELTGRIARSEAAELTQAKLLARALSELLGSDTRASTSLRRLLLGLETRFASALARRLHGALSSERGENMLAVIAPELLRSMADELWTSIAPLRLGELFRLLDKQDLEDFVVLGHGFWLDYRKSPYFHRIMQEMVEHFFAKYGEQSLAELVEDMGVSEQMVARELALLLEPLIANTLESGVMERQLRAQLRSFYDSDACRSMFSER
jgi:hypothetical protein